jgi:hypothetical protein
MNRGITVQAIYSDADLVQIVVSAWTGFFGGTTEIYCGWGVLEEAANKIQRFPSGPKDMREVILGTFDRKSAGGGVALRFHCVGGAGHAFVEGKIDSGYEAAGTIEGVVFSMPIEAAAVDIFAAGLRRLEIAKSGKAHLSATGRSEIED